MGGISSGSSGCVGRYFSGRHRRRGWSVGGGGFVLRQRNRLFLVVDLPLASMVTRYGGIVTPG